MVYQIHENNKEIVQKFVYPFEILVYVFVYNIQFIIAQAVSTRPTT